jgi:C4-dicarboxylate transporter, DctM subunit
LSPIYIGIMLVFLLLVVIFIGVPIGIGLGLIGVAGVWYLVSGNAAIAKLSYIPYQVLTSYDYACLPLFILMAQVCFSSGIGRDLYNLAAKWLGRFPGGLAMATIAACAGFASVSSSGVATTTTVGLVAIPEMKRYNYHPSLISGSVVTGGTLGPLIPPSGLMIYYGILTSTSIGDLFIAGLIPGLIISIFYVLTIYGICKINPRLGPQGPSSSFKEKITGFRSSVEIIILIILVLGGLFMGWFTPTEAGAVGAAGAILICLIRKRLNLPVLKDAIFQTLITVGMVYIILIGAMLFTPALTASNLPIGLVNFVASLTFPPFVIMIIIIIGYIILGTFMDEVAMMFTTVPIIFPLVFQMGFDPVWFGVMVVVLMMTATISPPLGINMFVVSAIAKDISMKTIWKGTIPFMAANIAFIILLLFVPNIALFLPSIMK